MDNDYFKGLECFVVGKLDHKVVKIKISVIEVIFK